MNIYTKTGDSGETALFGGTRVPKSDARVAAYGTVDELNAQLGLCAALLDPSVDETIIEWLHSVQSDLFTVGSHIATPHDSPARETLPQLSESIVTRLEEQIDSLQEELPELTNFILPGGIAAAAHLHIARTTCRRAERGLTEVERSGTALQYLNRLSDWLFVLARAVNARNGATETEWSA
jgi:cob(I)alamin adenosyltransferase